MFTGLVSAIGNVLNVSVSPTGGQFLIAAPFSPDVLKEGASVAHNGCCLTAYQIEKAQDGVNYWVDAVPETLRKTNLGQLQGGDQVNLEPSLCMGDEIDGHFVTGHIDALARLEAVEQEGNALRWELSAPPTCMAFIAAKGSVTLDGVSLTVGEVERDRFTVFLIPHTAKVTTLGDLRVGAQINLEVDLLARYVARKLDFASDLA